MGKTDFNAVPKTRKIYHTSPGEVLANEFLKPLGITNCRLAKEIGFPAQRIGESIAGRHRVTSDSDPPMPFFNLSDGWWMRLQVDYDMRIARGAIAKELWALLSQAP